MLDTQKRVVNEAMGGYALGVNVVLMDNKRRRPRFVTSEF